VRLTTSRSNHKVEIVSAGILRTARKIMEGELFVPAGIWPVSA
jgi:2-methylaconitate cis-trans-isomerase PrpF